MTSCVRRTVLPGGLRVVTEEMAGARSASIGVWVGVGSRDETRTLHGCSHFLEHLLFKGTRDRSALDISVALDAVGGEFNAFTAKEYTCFHARVLDQDLPLAVDVLGEAKAVRRQRRHHEQRRPRQRQRPALDLGVGDPAAQVQNLKQHLVPVRADVPVMAPAAFGDRLAVQAVGADVDAAFAVQRVGGRRWRQGHREVRIVQDDAGSVH